MHQSAKNVFNKQQLKYQGNPMSVKVLSPKQSEFFPTDFIAPFIKTIAQHVKWFAFYASICFDVSGKMKTSAIQILLGKICIFYNNSLCSVLLLSNRVLFCCRFKLTVGLQNICLNGF